MDDAEFQSKGLADLKAKIEGAKSASELESYGAIVTQREGIIVSCTHSKFKRVFYFNNINETLIHYSTI